MTLSQKILAVKSGRAQVDAGELVMAKLDMVLGNDITAPVAISEFYNAKKKRVFDKDKVSIVLDHFVPNKDIKSAEQCKICRDFASSQSLTNFFDVGKMGIEHALLPELGLAAPSELIIGADSHTCTYGAVAAFSTGVGSTDMAYGMAQGELWFKVPSAIKVELVNRLNKNVSGKDVILHLIGQIGVDGALYKSLEFCGEGAHSLSIDDRFTICNMAIEAGAKNGIFEYDEVTASYVKDRVMRPFTPLYADKNAHYERTVTIELDKIKPTVSCPHLPSNTKAADTLNNIKIDQVVIGSCTNGRISDLKAAADVLRGKKVKDGVRVIVIPATNAVYLEALRAGYIEDFINAGAIVSTPTCGPCLGGYMGILAKGEVCLATTNRNFVGRMGHNESYVYLCSPFVAASSAVLGHIGVLEA